MMSDYALEMPEHHTIHEPDPGGATIVRGCPAGAHGARGAGDSGGATVQWCGHIGATWHVHVSNICSVGSCWMTAMHTN